MLWPPTTATGGRVIEITRTRTIPSFLLLANQPSCTNLGSLAAVLIFYVFNV